MEQFDIRLSILSPEKILYKGNVSSVTLPGKSGEFTVLRNHAALISSLDKGTIKYQCNDGEQTMDVKNGFVEINDNIVSVCVEQ